MPDASSRTVDESQVTFKFDGPSFAAIRQGETTYVDQRQVVMYLRSVSAQIPDGMGYTNDLRVVLNAVANAIKGAK